MWDITIDLGDKIDQHDIDILRTTLRNMNTGDEVVIRMETVDAHESGKVTEELNRHGFDYQPHGGSGKDFYFTAFKK